MCAYSVSILSISEYVTKLTKKKERKRTKRKNPELFLETKTLFKHTNDDWWWRPTHNYKYSFVVWAKVFNIFGYQRKRYAVGDVYLLHSICVWIINFILCIFVGCSNELECVCVFGLFLWLVTTVRLIQFGNGNEKGTEKKSTLSVFHICYVNNIHPF